MPLLNVLTWTFLIVQKLTDLLPKTRGKVALSRGSLNHLILFVFHKIKPNIIAPPKDLAVCEQLQFFKIYDFSFIDSFVLKSIPLM